MTEQDLIHSITLSRVLHFNVATQRLLIENFGSATAVYEHRHDIQQIFPDVSAHLTAALEKMEDMLPRAEQELDFIHKKGIKCLGYNDEDYPSRLRECDDAPILLFYKGNADLNRRRVINMIGTRHCTEYGKDICRHFLAEIKHLSPDILVVSGLAYGIDINSHREALANGLDTVGVLAHGLDRIYPNTHRNTAIEMMSHGGLLTEFMSSTNADKMNFVRRNRIVAGMSDATIVVESADKGGALITAGMASDYHRDVFAFPGRTSDRYSQGCNNLIRDNKATLIQSAQDFLEAIGWETQQKAIKNNQQMVLFPDLNEEEQRIVSQLRQQESMQINLLAVATNIPIHQLSAHLFNLEMKGIVKLMSGGMYRLL